MPAACDQVRRRPAADPRTIKSDSQRGFGLGLSWRWRSADAAVGGRSGPAGTRTVTAPQRSWAMTRESRCSWRTGSRAYAHLQPPRLPGAAFRDRREWAGLIPTARQMPGPLVSRRWAQGSINLIIWERY